MTKYDVWFVPNRDKNPDALERHDSSWRGLDREAATNLAFQMNTHMDDPSAGVFKMKAASNWARPGFSWWGSNNEERFTEGPYPTAEQALLAALSNEWPQIHLVEAKFGDLRIPAMGERVLEMINDANEDLGDPDGDPLFARVGAAQYKALDEALTATVQRWMQAHDCRPAIWAFDVQYDAPVLVIDLENYLKDAIIFSFNTFGPGARTNGVIDHITKELVEVQTDEKEWVDVAILALDGAWRAMTTGLDEPSVETMVDRLCGMALHQLEKPGDTFDEIWHMLRQMPDDPALWVALHLAAMRSSRHLHASYSEDKEPVYQELFAKLIINKLRVWPDWRTAERGKAIEHDRTGE